MSNSNSTIDDPPQTPTAGKLTSVAVAVPVRNEAKHIAQTLDQILDQQLDGVELEILVVDGNSSDCTREIVQSYVENFPNIRLLDNPQQLSSAARNLAIRESESDYFVVIDGHCEIPSRCYFSDLVQAFQESGADCLGRPQPLDVTQATPLQQAIALARSSRLGHHPESFIFSDQGQFVPAKSVAIAYRREVFDQVGYFDENFDAHEDGEFNYRCDQAGMICYLDPKLTVRYFPRSSLGGLFRQMRRYGRGRVRLARKHPGMWGIGALIPAVLVAYILIGGVLAFVNPNFGLIYLLGLLIYLVALLSSGVNIAWQNRDPSLLLRIPLVLTTVHLGAGVGTLAEFFTSFKIRNSKSSS